MNTMKTAALALALMAAGPAPAALDVFACEPEWGALAKEIAGDSAHVYVATTAEQDPHYIQARPSLISEIRNADLLACTGAELEVGWLPLLLRRGGSPDIQTGAKGQFLAAPQVRRLEIPSQVDRSQGDIHPQGNPHVHLNPHNLLRIADQLAERMSQLDPANAGLFRQRLAAFESAWRKSITEWEKAAAPLAGKVVITQHRSFSYLADWLDLIVAANIEPKPGIPPSGAHLSRLLDQFRDNPPAAILRTPYEDTRPSDWLGERLGVPVITLPYTVGGLGTSDLADVFHKTLELLLEAME